MKPLRPAEAAIACGLAILELAEAPAEARAEARALFRRIIAAHGCTIAEASRAHLAHVSLQPANQRHARAWQVAVILAAETLPR